MGRSNRCDCRCGTCECSTLSNWRVCFPSGEVVPVACTGIGCHEFLNGVGYFLSNVTECYYETSLSSECGSSAKIVYNATTRTNKILDITVQANETDCYPVISGCPSTRYITYRYNTSQPVDCENCVDFIYSGVVPPNDINCSGRLYTMPTGIQLCPTLCLDQIVVIGIIDEASPYFGDANALTYSGDKISWENYFNSTISVIRAGVFQPRTGSVSRNGPEDIVWNHPFPDGIHYGFNTGDPNYPCRDGNQGRFTPQQMIDFFEVLVASGMPNGEPFQPAAVVFSKDTSGSITENEQCALEEVALELRDRFNCITFLEDVAASNELWVENMELALSQNSLICDNCTKCNEAKIWWGWTADVVNTPGGCDDYSGIYVLTHDLSAANVCTWSYYDLEADPTFTISLDEQDSDMVLTITVGNNSVTYSIASASFDCYGPNTLTLVSDETGCDFAGTIDIDRV